MVTHRGIVWLVLGLLVGGALLLVTFNSGLAQVGPVRVSAFGPAPGRFVVAHAGPERIVILDSATGQVYVAKEKDFKPMSEMPKVTDRPVIRPPAILKGGDKDGEKRDREDRRRDKDGEKRDREDRRRDKEGGGGDRDRREKEDRQRD